MLPIQIKHIKYNFRNSGTKKIYIVIHDTGNTNRGADAIAHFNYFNGGDRQSSANYFIDGDNIIETVDSYMDSWHCGDGHGVYGITNKNSIGIEICVNSDGNYDKAIKNAIELTKYLMAKHGIPVSNVVRHYDASRKSCPSSMSANSWAKWNWFKVQLATPKNYLSKGDNGSAVVELQQKLIKLGYSCGVCGADGDFGQGTDDAVRKFQAANGLTVDGLVGNGTMTKINEKIASIGKYGIVTASNLNVRSGAGAGYSVIGSLLNGTKVKISSEVPGWINIYFGDHGGWVSAQYIKKV